MRRPLKVHWPMIAWGLAFGLAATITGLYVLAAVGARGFFAEGFFLLVVGWVIIFMGAAKLVSKMNQRLAEDAETGDERE